MVSESFKTSFHKIKSFLRKLLFIKLIILYTVRPTHLTKLFYEIELVLNYFLRY